MQLRHARPRRGPARAARPAQIRHVWLEGGPTLAAAFVARRSRRRGRRLRRAARCSAPARPRSATPGSRTLAEGLRLQSGRRRPRSATTYGSRWSGRTEMFTGIVEELGEVVAVEPQADAARLTVRGPLVTATPSTAPRSPSTASASPSSSSDGRHVHRRRHGRDAATARASGALVAGRAGQPRATRHAGRPARRAPRAGPRRRRPGAILERTPERALGGRADRRCPPSSRRYVVDEGVDHRRRRVPHRRRRRRRLVHGQPDPHDARAHHPGAHAGRRPRQPRGRRHREVRREAAGGATS